MRVPKGKSAPEPWAYSANGLTHVVLQEGHFAAAEEKDVDLILFRIPTTGGPITTVDIQPAKK